VVRILWLWRRLNPEIALGFLIATLFWIAILGWQASYALSEMERQQCRDVAEKSGTKGEECKAFWEKTTTDPVAFFTLWLVIFTGGLTISTILLWRAGERQTAIARQAMIAGERAFVFTTGLAPFWDLDPATNLYNWRFRPTWKNSGDTPTRLMTMHSECVLRDTPLPSEFDFNYPTTDIGTALIPPNTETHGGIAPRGATAITPQDILDIQAGRKFLYYWGWARYFDVFPDTPQHITRFAWQVLPLGDPFAYNPTITPQNLIFPNVILSAGNCADDECCS
jgi:hypothetical protein